VSTSSGNQAHAVTAHGVSHQGNVRSINEDRLFADVDLGVFVVADGLGGHNAGEVASELAVESIVASMRRTLVGEDVTWPYGFDQTLSFHANRLVTAVRLANRRVLRAAEGREDFTGMGTTVVLGLVDAGRFVFASVGDSRIYSFGPAGFVQLTTDDSWVATLQKTEGTAAVPKSHPMRHVLTNVVGARDELAVQVAERELADGETLLFCSDGVHTELSDAEIAGILAARPDVSAAADTLLATILERPARDNVTALVVRYQASAALMNSPADGW
jgi:serine/threonine protein phosphatase PrpC